MKKDAQFYLETPSEWTCSVGDMIRVSGWGFSPTRRLAEMSVLVGKDEYAAQVRMNRPDVQAYFQNQPNSLESGFACSVTVRRKGKWALRLRLGFEDGSTELLDPEKVLEVSDLPLSGKIRNYRRISGMVVEKSVNWVRARKRLPRPREIPELVKMLRHAFAVQKVKGTETVPPGFEIPRARDAYACWVENNRCNERRRGEIRDRLGRLGRRPLISVLMPVYNASPSHLEEAVGSVLGQVYDNWELCIADDASTNRKLQRFLHKLPERDARIRVEFRPVNGNISEATNSAAGMAKGNYLLFLDQDDLLEPDALAEAAIHLDENPETDLLYSDDDKAGAGGVRLAPQFKPDWSPELLLSYMYFSHFFLVRASLFRELGGFRKAFDGSQDYDFALRASERARHVGHIPRVLYHWRICAGSTASSGSAKPASFEAGRRAVQEALDRRGLEAEAYQPDWAKKCGVGIFRHRFDPTHPPSVAIVIPTRNMEKYLRRCVDSILAKTRYPNYRVVIVDNESDDERTLDYFREVCAPGSRVCVRRVPNPDGGFNFSYLNNRTAEAVEDDFLLFLNNDTEILRDDWLTQMVGYAQQPGVGAVGARLIFPDGRIQHAGIVHGLYDGFAGPAFKLLPASDHGYLSYTQVSRNYLAVTAACMLTPRRLFLEMGGFDETRLGVAYNDVDYCYRLADAGYRCVYVPEAELRHHEGASRGSGDHPGEEAYFRKKYAGRRDRYYNPNLSLGDERFQVQSRCAVLRPPPRPVRAFMCGFNLNLEGAPFSQYEVTAALKEQGVLDPVVFSPEDGPLREYYERIGVEVIVDRHPLADIYTLPEYREAIRGFAKTLRSRGTEVVYGNTMQTFYAMAAACEAALPAIWNIRESEPWQTYFNHFGPDINLEALGCFPYPYRVVFVAHATRQRYEPLNTRHNFTVIHNALKNDRLAEQAARACRETKRAELGIAPGETAVLLLGTVCRRKGQHDLVRALEAIDGSLLPRLRMVVVGDRDNDYAKELHALVDALPPERRERILLVKETEDVAPHYQAADLFVCTSRLESYPRVIMEAMFFGLPVVTTPVFGITEQVREGVNALYYTPENVPGLTGALERLLRDPNLRESMGRASRELYNIFPDFPEVVDAYARVFREAYFSLEQEAR